MTQVRALMPVQPRCTWSVSMRPSRSRTTRLANRATSFSWVMMTTVRPASLSAASNFKISVLEAVSRLPVGSSASRIVDQRSGDHDPLLLTAGELSGQVLATIA